MAKFDNLIWTHGVSLLIISGDTYSKLTTFPRGLNVRSGHPQDDEWLAEKCGWRCWRVLGWVLQRRRRPGIVFPLSRNTAPAAAIYHFDFLVTSLFIRCDSVAFEISPAAEDVHINDFPP